MLKSSKQRRGFCSFYADKAGNIAIMAAVLMPLVAGVGGVAIDTSNLMWAKSKLQGATDSAALAASSGLANETMTLDEAKKAAIGFLRAELGSVARMGTGGKNDMDSILKDTLLEVTSKPSGVGSGKEYLVTVKSSLLVPLNPLTKLLGLSDATVNAASESYGSTATESALSMYLVLDRSGSMGEATNKKGVSKIASLKVAVEGLLAQFSKADPDSSYVRTAAVSYNGAMDTPSGLSWDEATTLAYVKKLTATGSTDSSVAMKTAHAQLTDGKDAAAHKAKTGLTPRSFMVFMTDGDNTTTKNDTDTKAVCEKARVDKVTVYTVAFMAPTKGKALLEYCATSKAHSFQAEDADALVAAFASIGRDASKLAVRLTK